ncbi:Lnb N-terminal periplasmic domain-containing protein [Flavobacterium hauense]
MHNIKVLTVLLLTLFIVTAKTYAQVPLSPQANVSLLTCGPGNELYSVYGHTAIRVSDPATRFDVVYNFGTFDFDTPNFYPKFVKGDLQYFASAGSYEDFVYTYQYYNRDVFEQPLNITLPQKQAIADELADILVTDKRFYNYKFIHRNCTTMVADILNRHLPGKISLKNSDSGLTYRKILHKKVEGHFFEDLGINLALGAPTDKTSEKLFLPHELMEGVNNTTTSLGPLAISTQTVYKATEEQLSFSFNNFYVFGLLCLLLIALTGKKLFQRSLLAIGGLLGIFFCILGLYSSHTELMYNYNALLFNPLFLVLLYFIFAHKAKAIILTSYVCFASIAVYIIFTLNKPTLLLVSPLLLLFTITLARIYLAARKQV